MKFRITVMLCTLLCACAAQQPMILAKPGGDAVQRHKDLSECGFEAAKATAGSSSAASYNLSDAVVHDTLIRQRQEQLVNMCMQVRGYTYQPINQVYPD
jgi:hypothetical protein